jgi:hypothetical protein
MRLILLSHALLLLAAATLPAADGARFDKAAPDGYYLATTPGRRVKATLHVTLGRPGADVAEWSIYAPSAPTCAGQRAVKTTLTPNGRLVHELSALRRPMLASRLTGRGNEVRLVLTVEATLIERRLRPREPGLDVPKVANLSAADAKLYTRATPSLDLKAKPLVAWLARHELRRGKDESELAFARRVYSFIKQHFEYEYEKGQDIRPATVCQNGKSDCGGLSTLFVATLRASGVPARLLQGRWAHSEERGSAYKQWHIEAEFFARGIGWVPVDLASAVLDGKAGAFAHFGNDPGNFLTLHLGHDLVMPRLTGGRDSRFGIQSVAYWWRGQGTPRGEHYEETWTVETVK